MRSTIHLALAAALVAAFVTESSTALAQKKPGGGGATTTPFSVIELPFLDDANALNNPDAGGFVTVVGSAQEGNWYSAAYARVDMVTRRVVASGFLPEPTDGTAHDTTSDTRDINAAGVVVGWVTGAGPVRWSRNGAGYSAQVLPLPDGYTDGSASGINDGGVMVGTVNVGDPAVYRAVVWSADGSTVAELSNWLPPESGWTLIAGNAINNHGLIVGTGTLNGVERGLVLDLGSGAFTAIPLPGNATSNEGWDINDSGEVIGKAYGGSIPPGGWSYVWAGPGATPQLLPSAKAGAATARSINALGDLAGDCNDPAGPWGNGDQWLSAWRPSGDGYTVADLNPLVPIKPVWYLRLGLGINDHMCVAGKGRKFDKGKYDWMGVLVVPNP